MTQKDDEQTQRSFVNLLNETALLATGCGAHNEASRILAAIRILRPQSEFPYISEAIASMNKGQWNEAISLIDNNVLSVNPNNSVGLSFKALALKCCERNNEAKVAAQKAMENSKEEWVVNLAKEIAS